MTDAGRKQSQFYLKLGGSSAPPDLMRDLEQVTVESSLHLPDVASLVLHDPELRWVDHALVAPGVTLQVVARVGREEETLFDGEVVELEPEFAGAAPRLVVRAFDRLHRLARGTRARAFANVSDEELLRRLADEAGLRSRVGPAAGRVHPYLLQANESNLALLQRRAAELGYLLYVEGSTLCCLPPESDERPLALAWGDALTEFFPRLTTVDQVSTVTVRGWDVLGKRPVYGQAGESALVPAVGQTAGGRRRSGGELARSAFDVDAELLVAALPVRNQAAADTLAQAIADRRGARFIEAEGRCRGTPALVAGVRVEVGGVGERFGGTYFVTGARHTSDASGDYSTSFQISGLAPATLLSLLAPEPYTGLPTGLALAVVADNADPEEMGRVRLAFPWLDPEVTSDWARVVAAGAGDRRGIAFLPEVGDEVLVGFEMGDIHHPYVLGGLWNGLDRPPAGQSDLGSGEVRRRRIRSRTGHEIVLDEGGDGGVTIRDRRGNTITLSSGDGSITIESAGDLALRAGASLRIEATGPVTVSGAGVSVDGKAANVDIKGQIISLN